MATTQRLPSGRWRGVYRDSAGKQCYTKPPRDRKSDAYDDAVDAQSTAKRRAPEATSGAVSAKTTWGEWWDSFAANREFVSDSKRTEEQNVRLHLYPQWGEIPLNRIERGAVQQWVDTLSRKYAPSYVRRIFGTFTVSIRAAYDRGILAALPIAGIRLPRKIRKPKPFLPASEIDALLEHMKPGVRDAVMFMADTGLRPNELTGLHAHRVDLERGWCTAAESYIYRARKIRPYPKDREARVLPLTDRAAAAARRALADRDLKAGCGVEHVDGKRCRHPLVFTSPRGRPLNRDLLLHHLYRAALAAEQDTRSGYAVRRGFATRLGEAGLDVFAIADLMGHEDVNLTREYVQQSEDVRARTLAALGERAPLSLVDTGDDGGGDVKPDVKHGVKRREASREADRDKVTSREGSSGTSTPGGTAAVTSDNVS